MFKNYLLGPILFFSAYATDTMACACFNSNFLSSIFADSKTIICDAYMKDNVITGLRISDNHNQAFSQSPGCELKADYHNISRSYDPMTYIYENNKCIKEILLVCKSVNAQITYN